MNRILIGIMLLLSTLPVTAADTAVLMDSYRTALDQQDTDGLAGLISQDATVRLLLEQPGKAPLALTLTRQEYLQQMRALWRFSETDTYKLSDARHARAEGAVTVAFTQLERYQLLGESLNRESDITLWIKDINGRALITRIEALVREW